MTGLIIILALALIAAYVNDSWRANERARGVARRACQQAGVQLLDGSVVRAAQRPARRDGHLAIERRYRFEFATDGASRHAGEVSLHGRRLRHVSLDWPEGRVVEGREAAGPPDR